MEQKNIINIIALLVNILILPGLGTIIHGETKRGLIQMAVLIISAVVITSFPPLHPLIRLVLFMGFLILFLIWLWGLLDGIAFVQNREFYVFKNLK